MSTASTSTASTSIDSSPFRILVVDDEPAQIRIATRLMTTTINSSTTSSPPLFHITTATNGEEALEIYRKAREDHQPFHLVCSDHDMPGAILQGADSLREIIEIIRSERHSEHESPLLILRTSREATDLNGPLPPEIHYFQKGAPPEETKRIKDIIFAAYQKHSSPPTSASASPSPSIFSPTSLSRSPTRPRESLQIIEPPTPPQKKNWWRCCCCFSSAGSASPSQKRKLTDLSAVDNFT
jgi:CheY-like chemotaxis protein